MTPARRPRAVIVALLLLHFLLRVAQPLALPGYVDEGSHLARARVAYRFAENPLTTSHGKFLFYYWLGLFGPAHTGELAAGRLAVALFSLLTAAAVAAAARDLYGHRAAPVALALYALVPFAAFFERMALADPFAGGLGALLAWQSVRLARAPSPRRGVVVGLLAAAAPLAKLTAAPLALLPPLAAILLTPSGTGLAAAWRRAWPALRAAGLACAAIWVPYLGVAAWMYNIQGVDPIVIDTFLLQTNAQPETLATKLADTWDTAAVYLSVPLVVALLAGSVALLWRRTRPALFVLSWLLLLWGPSIMLAGEVQPRYLMAGVPALAVLGGGIVATGRAWVGQRYGSLASRAARAVAWLALGVWAISFALPFASLAASDPARLHLTDKDNYNYFHGQYNGWGIALALDYLAAEAAPHAERIPVAVVMRNCGVVALHLAPPFEGACIDWHSFPEDEVALDAAWWTPVHAALAQGPAVYAITEYLPPGEPPPGGGLRWTLLHHFNRPHGDGPPVTVWRVERTGDG